MMGRCPHCLGVPAPTPRALRALAPAETAKQHPLARRQWLNVAGKQPWLSGKCKWSHQLGWNEGAFPGGAPLGHPGDKWTRTPYYWEIHLLGLGGSLRGTPTVLVLGLLPRRLV